MVALVGGGIAILSGRDDPPTDTAGQTADTGGPTAIPIQVLDDSVEVGSPSAPVSIDIFDEPICPQCGDFITSAAADLSKAVEDEKLAIRYHLVNFLDGESASGNYSTRALAASLCVADANDAKLYMDFYHGIFAPDFQPKEKALSDRNNFDLADLAEGLGASPEVRTCIKDDEKRSAAESVAKRAQTGLDRLNDGTTPAVFENDVPVDIDRRNWVEALG